MLKTRIIPCLDVKDGRVVKGINFLDLVDAGDPVKQASYYSQNGADEICFLDISASLENRSTMLNVVRKTAEEVFIPLTVGGGISSNVGSNTITKITNILYDVNPNLNTGMRNFVISSVACIAKELSASDSKMLYFKYSDFTKILLFFLL